MKLLGSLLRALRVVFMLFLLCLTLLFYIVVETPYGLKLINTFLPLFLPFSLQIESPRGALLDVLYADKVVYRDSTVDVEVTNAKLRLDAVSLFLGEIKIDAVKADDVKVIILDSGGPSTLTREKLLQNLTLPFSLRISSASLKHLLVEESNHTPWVDLQNAELSALMNGEPHFTLRAQWREGNLHLIPDVPLHSRDGQFSVDGKLPNYRVSFNSQLQQGEEQSKGVRIIGYGDFSGLKLNKVKIQQVNDTLIAPMQITWLPHFQWTIPSLSGKIHDYPVTGHIAMRTDGDHWQIDDSEIKIHDASVQLTGQYQKEAQFSFKLAIPRMQTLFTGAKGHVFAEGICSGTTNKPQIHATLEAADISIPDYLTLKRLQGNLQAKSLYPISANSYWTQFQVTANAIAEQINMSGQGVENANVRFEGALDGTHAASLKADIQHLQLNTIPMESLLIDATNKNARQKVNIALTWGEKKIKAAMSGYYQNQSWQGALESVDTNFNIHLQKKNSILVTANSVQINSTCFSLMRSQLCGSLDWQKDKSFNAKLNGKNIPTNTISQFLLPQQKVNGTFSLDAAIAGDGHYIQSGNLNFALSKGEVISDNSENPFRFPFEASQIAVVLSNKGLAADGNLNLLGQPPIRWQVLAPKLQLNDPNWSSTPINGYLQFSTRELALLAKMDPQLKNIKGLLSADLKINGTLNKPQLLGSLQFKDGQLDVPKLGLHLTPIQFNITAQNNKIVYTGSINTNPGLLSIDGYTDLNADKSKTQLQIKGNNVTVMNTSEYKVTVSPQLQLTWLDSFLNVDGQILIPTAQLSPIDLGDTVTLSRDVVFVNGTEKKEKTNLPIRTHVKIILGDAIILKAKGLTARLAGTVDVKESENSAQTTGIGQINVIDGRFKGHGQDLKIRTGRVIFTGGTVTNPGLYVEAVRTVSTYVTAGGSPGTSGQNSGQSLGALQSDVVVGARITGTVDTPQITFFSEPAGLTQSQILSYLVLGKGESSGSSFDTTLLLKAVSFLDIGGSETAATKNTLQKDLGLDEIGVQSQQEYSAESQSLVNNTSLVLGKALSPKLFIDYSIGLIEPINILHIRYKLSDHFAVRSESNINAQGIDLFYSIER
ncbi:MAG: translocation/assembly module TamB domain-containing protein [Gammaproteobacteria bacterium]|nr:translocation/assembly module TamB domain-containing protein [Gammaproteobacteria bacterium]